ncbi:Mov34/MPN/PAD-1 family protein [Caballeronia sp. ATUFL_F1_KS4A]|uniref:C40 family peptidase n=1 Tax=Caballeronia sp. ATUFL_F1_KS4A TaxID=2921768 RepID=UPI0032ED81FB
MIGSELRAAIEADALRCYPNESCGLVVAGQYIPCTNVAPDPSRDFTISPCAYAQAEEHGAIQAVVHSHPDASAWPSLADILACQASLVSSWLVVSVRWEDKRPRIGRLHRFDRVDNDIPLIGASFEHGTQDCYGLVRRYYRAALGAILPDFARSGMWWEDGQSSLYVDNYAAAGFMSVGRDAVLRTGDVLLMAIASRRGVPNHAAVYLGGDEILHHLWNQLSRRDSLPRYCKHVTHVLRYQQALE